ncbi:MAG TPA: hypothetical protein VH333_25575 [Pseudonocardiaceae bacterium]|nr:hypothetical protein [Pseudonocardiaceae bacterium]
MPIGDRRVAGWWRLLPSQQEKHIGERFMLATRYQEDLTLRQRARLQEEFADEFDRLPASQEPSEGWAKTMAQLCRDIGQRLRARAAIEQPVVDQARENRIPPIRIY